MKRPCSASVSRRSSLGVTTYCCILLMFSCGITLAKNAKEHEPILLVSSVDGSLVAVSKYSGTQLWHIKGDPLVRLSLPLDSRYFIQYDDETKALRHYHVMPDPDDGTMYLYSYALPPDGGADDESSQNAKAKQADGERSRSEVIRKLPFTIPELVQRSPYPSHDGIMYTGSKSDTWLEVQRDTGKINRIFLANGDVQQESDFMSLNTTNTGQFDSNDGASGPDRVESDSGSYFYLGKTEYRVSVFDRYAYWDKSTLIWNLTYTNYAARSWTSATKRERGDNDDPDYDLIHLCSNANGLLLTFRRSTGEFLWHMNAGRSPIASLYELVSPVRAADAEDDAPPDDRTRKRSRRPNRDQLAKVPFMRFGDETIRRGYEYLFAQEADPECLAADSLPCPVGKRTLQQWFRAVLGDTLDSLSLGEAEALERMRIAALLATLYVRMFNESTLVALPTVVDTHTFLFYDRLRAAAEAQRERADRTTIADPHRLVGYHVPDEDDDWHVQQGASSNWRRLTARFERLLLEGGASNSHVVKDTANADSPSPGATCRALIPRSLQIFTDNLLHGHQLPNYDAQHSHHSITWSNEEAQDGSKKPEDVNRKRSTCSSYELLFDEWERGASTSESTRKRISDGSHNSHNRQPSTINSPSADGETQTQTENSLQPASDSDMYAYFYEQFFEMQSIRDGLHSLDTKIQIGLVALIVIVFFFGYYHPKHVERNMHANLQRMLDQQFSQLLEQQRRPPDDASKSSNGAPSSDPASNSPQPSTSTMSELGENSRNNSGVLTLNGQQRLLLGKIELCVAQEFLLGYGSNGTAVYRGKFEARQAAVKRTVKTHDCVEDNRELEMLSTLQHPNLVRYLCMEEDGNFRYLALELCDCTLDRYLLDQKLTPTKQQTQKLPTTEICEQILCGLNYLHSLDIVHRDLKPGNVLISLADLNGQRRVVLTDFGFSKRLLGGPGNASEGHADLQSGLDRIGTRGWVAPELFIANVQVTCAIDVFAAGCLFFYVLTHGAHPFDPASEDGSAQAAHAGPGLNVNIQRQANIMDNRYSLDKLARDEHCEARDLITKMIAFHPVLRPPAKRVANHPFFWSALKRLQFLLEFSDRIEKTTNERDEMIVRMLDANISGVLRGNDWRTLIGAELQADLRKFRTYRGDSVRDLLRAIRNKKHHYRELTDELQRHLGALPDGFLAYFTTRFPRLLMHTYAVTETYCKDESNFRQYFES